MTVAPHPPHQTVSRLVARFLVAKGVSRVYGLVGGHIQPLWDELADAGVTIVDVRHESAAVYMAHAQAALTGTLGVAIVTAGPGLTNAVTGIANASVARVPVLVISGCTPRPQIGMGAMQDVPQADIVRPLCRRTERVLERHQVLPCLDAAVRAAFGSEGATGPSYIEFPTDLQREIVADGEADDDWFAPWQPTPRQPDPSDVRRAAEVIRGSRRPLVIGGRSVHRSIDAVRTFVGVIGALYLDTGDSRGAIPASNDALVSAMRGQAMAEADVIITLGRRLDFQLAYGSRAVFAEDAHFIRIGAPDEISDNRRGAAEICADVELALNALVQASPEPVRLDTAWRQGLIAANLARRDTLATRMREARAASDGRMHPYHLIAALNEVIDDDTVTVVDGGDILSFARVGLKPSPKYLDPGTLGCIGVGVPFANAASLSLPGKRVIALIGDGSLGFSAMELYTAVRRRLPIIFVIANNAGWNIDRHDQRQSYRHIVGVELPDCRYDLVARGLGLHSRRVEDRSALADALGEAIDRAPSLLDVVVSGEPTSPDFDSGLAEVCARQALRKWHEAEERRLTRTSLPTT